MQEMASPWLEKVESPSAMRKNFSSTPQPKPDLGQGPVAGYGMPLDCLGLNLALEAGLMKSQNSSAKRTPNISSTTSDNSSSRGHVKIILNDCPPLNFCFPQI
jgi:hypothetical protein